MILEIFTLVLIYFYVKLILGDINRGHYARKYIFWDTVEIIGAWFIFYIICKSF